MGKQRTKSIVKSPGKQLVSVTDVAPSQLQNPIRHWFQLHPEEIAPQNRFSAVFSRTKQGIYRCILKIKGKHHWIAKGSGPDVSTALCKSLAKAVRS